VPDATEIGKIFVARDGASLAYRLRRPGAPRRTLVLIHGLASNLTRWSEFVATTRLAADWDLLRLDLRGHGGSVWRGRVDVGLWCDDLAALLAAEGVARAVLVGHCLGASVALGFARRFPHATEGLVLIEPMFREALKGRLARVARWRAALVPAVAALKALAALGVHRRALAPLDLERLDREARAAMARAGSAFPEKRYSSPWEDLKSFPASVYLQDLLAVTARLPDLTEIRTPVLALLSSGAAFTQLALTARRLAELPRCETVVLDAQHWIPTEQSEAMRRAIEAWCDALKPPRE
jgi:pimeloyl-ACP methyl ester carboxylesterase